MNKIIIENRTDKSWDLILRMVSEIIREGRVSEGKNGSQFCFLTRFALDFNRELHIVADRNKKSDRFIAYEVGS